MLTMARLPPHEAHRPARTRGGGLLGAVVFAVGLALMILVMVADIGGSPQLEALAYRLGLATAPLLLAFGIALSLTGGWMLFGRRGR
jgi:hypothetical protein